MAKYEASDEGKGLEWIDFRPRMIGWIFRGVLNV